MNTKFGPKTTEALQKQVPQRESIRSAVILMLTGIAFWSIVIWLSIETVDRYLKGVRL